MRRPKHPELEPHVRIIVDELTDAQLLRLCDGARWQHSTEQLGFEARRILHKGSEPPAEVAS